MERKEASEIHFSKAVLAAWNNLIALRHRSQLCRKCGVGNQAIFDS